MKHRISVVIPMRLESDPSATIKSVVAQDGLELQLLIQVDNARLGANHTRNKGAERATQPYLLFCDDDIIWEPGAIAAMARCLDLFPGAAYVYGSYEMGGRVQCQEQWSAELLRKRNFVSTMSLIRREAFPGFDVCCQRLQDWDLWLTMLAAGHKGRQVGRLIFRTAERDGITRNGPCSYEDARAWIVRKHGLERKP